MRGGEWGSAHGCRAARPSPAPPPRLRRGWKRLLPRPSLSGGSRPARRRLRGRGCPRGGSAVGRAGGPEGEARSRRGGACPPAPLPRGRPGPATRGSLWLCLPEAPPPPSKSCPGKGWWEWVGVAARPRGACHFQAR